MLHLISPVESLNICFQIQPKSLDNSEWNQFNINVREKLLSKGRIMVNYANIKSTICIRLITANFKLKQKDLDFFFVELEKTANDLLAQLD